MEKELNHYLINDLVNIVCDYHYSNFKDCYDRLICEFSDIILNTRNQIEPVRTYSFGSKITLPLFSVSDSILTSYLLFPSVTIINAVFGGIVPKLSAYMVMIFSGAFLSRDSVSEIGLSVNLW